MYLAIITVLLCCYTGNKCSAADKKPAGSNCTTNDDCVSNYCQPGGRSGARCGAGTAESAKKAEEVKVNEQPATNQRDQELIDRQEEVISTEADSPAGEE